MTTRLLDIAAESLRSSSGPRHRTYGGRPMSDDDVIDIETQRKKRTRSRGKPLPHETFEQVLKRALGRARLELVPREHEVALLIWRVATSANSEPEKAATLLEMAAQRLRTKGGDDNGPTPAGA